MKERIDSIKVVLNQVGFVGERRAVALGGLAFFSTIFVIMGLLLGAQPDPETRVWAPCFYGLGACYTLGFFSLAAGWFWGRWFAIGLGSSGASMAIWSVVMTRTLPTPILVFGVVHGLVAALLGGEKMAALYDGREEWRKRFELDEQGVTRLRRSVTRAATSLPGLIVLALKPRDDADGMLLGFVAVVGMAGFAGLLRNRTWGVLAVGVAGAGAVLGGLLSTSTQVTAMAGMSPIAVPQIALLTGGFLLAAFAPFARPVARWLGSRL